MRLNYNQNKGPVPMLNDRVMMIHTNDDILDGLYGTVGGFSDIEGSIACVIMDEPLSNGQRVVCMTSVCLDFVSGENCVQ